LKWARASSFPVVTIPIWISSTFIGLSETYAVHITQESVNAFRTGLWNMRLSGYMWQHSNLRCLGKEDKAYELFH
jgi:hypothetical protein